KKGFIQKVHCPHPCLDDSLEGDIQAFLIDEDQLHTYDDLTKVNPVTPTTVLKCLQARYSVKVFYTHAGCTLVALNPFQPIPDLYTLDVMKEYHCAPQPQEFKPHIFIVAEEAYRNVQGQLEPVNQSLVVSGESGAGKTWTSRCLMKYYATVAASSSVLKSQDTVERIERRVLDSNPIMEAFGNACTLRNNNSSRFGKCQLLVGASVQTYLLEKTRVACQLADERNFHIFYQMMKEATDEQRKEWKMPPGQHYAWLPNSEKTVEGWAAELLCVPAEELQMCLRVRTLKAGKQSVLKPCSQAECSMRRVCLAKAIYAQSHESRSFSPCCVDVQASDSQEASSVLMKSLEEYVSEGLEWSFVKYQDNQSCLDLLEGSPVSVFSLLNEESRLNRASDSKTFRVRLEKELGDNANISWDKFSKEPHFTVAHYAGKVNYQLEGMVEKNKNSLENLMRILHSTTPHYTRCIKPNPDCNPLSFKKEEVIMQLKACGIVETIHISAAGFPIRIPFKGFMQRYGLIAKYSQFKSGSHCVDVEADSNNGLRQEAEELLRVAFDHSHKLDSEEPNSWVHCGRTKRKQILSRCAFSIQCCWQRYRRRRRHARQRSATLIQAALRSWLVRRRVQRWNRAAAVIQNTWRKRRALLKSLAEAELDDAKDFVGADHAPALDPVIRERGLVQLSSIQEPVPVRGWPMGLALASAPSITMSLTATGFQKVMSVMASLRLPSARRGYKVEPNQYSQELASIRAQPKRSVKLHYRRSPLLYADRQPDTKSDATGFNAILLEKTL
ncbi:hypothetical protein FQN60_000238, partial [Etheostoma spectabile]